MYFSKRQFQGMWATLTQHTQTLWASSRLKACITSIKRSTSSSSSCTPTACSPSQRLVGIKVFRILFTTDSLLSGEEDLSGQTFPPHFLLLSFIHSCLLSSTHHSILIRLSLLTLPSHFLVASPIHLLFCSHVRLFSDVSSRALFSLHIKDTEQS